MTRSKEIKTIERASWGSPENNNNEDDRGGYDDVDKGWQEGGRRDSSGRLIL